MRGLSLSLASRRQAIHPSGIFRISIEGVTGLFVRRYALNLFS